MRLCTQPIMALGLFWSIWTALAVQITRFGAVLPVAALTLLANESIRDAPFDSRLAKWSKNRKFALFWRSARFLACRTACCCILRRYRYICYHDIRICTSDVTTVRYIYVYHLPWAPQQPQLYISREIPSRRCCWVFQRKNVSWSLLQTAKMRARVVEESVECNRILLERV